MRILHFLPVYVPAWQFGGPILSVSRLCEGLVQEGVDVRVITTNAGLPDFPVDQLCLPQNVNGVQVTYYPVDNERGLIQSKSLVEALPNHCNWADLLHLSSIWQPLGISVQIAAHSAGLPVIQSLRGALGPYSWNQSLWKKLPYYLLREQPLLERVSALHCTTRQEANEISWLGLSPPIQLLPNPIDLSELYCKPSLGDAWRRNMGISTSEPLLIVVGRLHHKKGLDLLPNVLKRISHLPWQIAFIGKDEDGTGRRLKAAIERAGLLDRCHWFEHLPANQLTCVYNASHCLLLPSRHENFGNVVVEALACGCGVLISDRVGVAESIRDCAGVSISPRSVKRWSAELELILSSERPSILSAEFVAHTFSSQLLARQAITMYASIMNDG